ncbi:type VI secretion system-associated FHA domain protein TagH [Halomonas campisalis]|uniref:Type VI secretion system-associated FHA domain protein TagH n=1 Tax=Billgrantia campisalis TaxID=74661 RepID=A0ABS9P6S8_9GAMM|nr:type VI secretion system-associated FHA domain protein TagH [Halomonas campisalis]MCG6657486.1 type VI secretion system-associated FHA domain protein TagH [Halomonas campisalis]MDR5863167.1 type VI secretion system-associated FHA domain protein TagH [Halomonas campisalis]
MVLTLTVINEASSRLGDKASHRWSEQGGTLGRAPNNDWVLPDPKMEISRCHARIRYRDGRYFLEDASANGILLADGVTRMDPAEPLLLQDGQEFLIGDCRIRARIESPAESTSLSPEASPLLDRSAADEVPDPLELLGGAVETPSTNKAPAADSFYLNEHFSVPRYREAPPERAAPDTDPLASPESTSRAASQGPPAAEAPASEPLLPDDWWRDLPGAASHEASPPDEASAASSEPETPRPGDSRASVEPPPPEASPPPSPDVPQPPPPEATPPPPPDVPQPPPAEATPPPPPEASPPPAAGERPIEPPPEARQPAPASPQGSGPAPGASPDQALRQLLAGAGLDPDRVPPERAEELGRILRVAIQGVMDLLRARMEVKNEFRMSVTLIEARENNPLKFSTSPEDALHNLLVKQNPDYLSAVEAFEAGFEDLRFHQLAMLAGMRSGFFEMLHQFDPAHLEARFAEGDERGSLLGRVTGPRHWRQYQAHYAEIQRDSEGYFNRLFGEAFCDAYERQIQALKAHARRDR